MQVGELTLLRTEIAYIVLGTLFLFFGLAALTIAAIRERREIRILIWLGIWSGAYGFKLVGPVRSASGCVAAFRARRDSACKDRGRIPFLSHWTTGLVGVDGWKAPSDHAGAGRGIGHRRNCGRHLRCRQRLR